MVRVTRRGTKRSRISLRISSRSTIGVAATPRSATSRRFSSCTTGSRFSMNGKRRHDALPLEDEKPREPQWKTAEVTNISGYLAEVSFPRKFVFQEVGYNLN